MFHLTSLSLHSHSSCNLKTLKSQANHNQTLLNSSFFLLSLSSHFYLCYSLNTKWHTTTISATAGLEVGSNGCSSHQVASRPIADIHVKKNTSSVYTLHHCSDYCQSSLYKLQKAVYISYKVLLLK